MPIGDLLAQITGESSPTGLGRSASIPPPKRKADEQIRRPVDKIQKRTLSPANTSRPINPSTKRLEVSSTTAATKLGQNGQNSRRPSGGNSTTTTFKNGQPTPPPNNEPPKPLKKGSYAEIMQRAKLAQANSAQVGKIQHKRIEKLPSKREERDLKIEKGKRLEKNLAPNSKFQKPGQAPLRDARVRTGGTGAKEIQAKGPKPKPEPEKKVKKAATATTGYAGTARPKAPGSKGPSRASASASSSRYDRSSDRYGREGRGGSAKNGASYAYVSEEEDEQMEDEGDYESDVSSDMEAAVYEVDEEEEKAARIARQEDAEALAEENRHKREKEARKRGLIAMAKKRR